MQQKRLTLINEALDMIVNGIQAAIRLIEKKAMGQLKFSDTK